ncbi:MAG: SusC/RagA family protein [Aequorivita sp.]|nr:SusC/RagA family protein [Aequorivita sp.]MBF30546.1 SusC/RagA family protein [Aequorivita sp.]|tara:strand:- start:47121 stop:50402 length:3282 start_codon:yes stop_codon:yes gene_type:complete
MEIKLIKGLAIHASHLQNIIARTILLLSCTTIFGFSPNSLTSQNPKITIDQDRTVTIFEVFEIIGKQTACTFIYQSNIFKDLPKIKLKKGTVKVNELLQQCLPPADYTITTTKDNYITITRRISNVFPQGNIKGVVTDSLGMGMAGVNIIIKNTSKGTQSDLDGLYSIIAHPSDTLVFTYMGFKPREVAVGNQAIINVIMQPDATSLDQVVINAGYYKVSDREKTGSISRVMATEIENQPVNNPLEALQGRMPGVDIVQTSGVAGGGFTVRIRGQSSILAGNEPLYIIDGLPYNSQSLGSQSASGLIIPGADISPLNAIDPNSIESIEVLKDADATAIYGSRGANGVVLITTKKGKEGKTRFTIGSSTGIAHITRKIKLLNTEQYLTMRREAFANDGITEYPATAYDVNGTWNQKRYTDWQKTLIGGTARFRDLDAAISGGNENTQFRIDGRYLNETTVYPGDFNYDRVNLNSNLQHRSNDDRFQLGFTAGYTLENNLLPGSDLSGVALRLAPNAPALHTEDGALNWENSTWTNPLAQLEGVYNNTSKTLIGSTILQYEMLKNLDLKVQMGYRNSNFESNNQIPHTIYDPAYGLDSSVSQSYLHTGTHTSFITEPQINWTLKRENHSWNVLLGATFQSQKTDQLTLLGYGFANNGFLENLSAANTLIILNEDSYQYKYQSFFARLNYAFKKQLYFNLTGRRDGSSRFSNSNRYGNFGAIGAAWIFSEQLNVPWLNFGKLRGSYGITGNDQIADYQYLQNYFLVDHSYDGNIGLEPARIYNPNYQWEENEKREVALELGFFNGALELSTAYYNNRSSNQLIDYSLPATTGFPSIQANLDAIVENSGFEFELLGRMVRKEHFKWNSSLNLSLPKNKLVAFPGLENSTYSNQFVIGEPLNILKLYHLTGVNPETGLYEFEDYNGDDELSGLEDRQYLADLSPKILAGLSNSFTYHNWSFNLFLQYVKKDALNEYFGTEPPGTMSNQPTGVLDRWQATGDNAPIQQYTTGLNDGAYTAYSRFSQSNGIISDASFLRLKSMSISYSLPLANKKTRTCKVSLMGQNLFTFTNFKGGDPEQTKGFLPPLRRISLQVQFQI